MITSIPGKYEFLKPEENEEYFKYVRQYTSSVHIFYRYLCRDTAHFSKLKDKSVYYKKKSDMLYYFNSMNNVELIQKNEWFRHCAFYDAYDLIETRGRHVVFGGRKDYKDYLKGMMTKEEYLQQKLRPFYCIGTAKPYKGNQKFRLKEDLETVVFQPSRNQHLEFRIYDIPYNRKQLLRKVYEMQENKNLPITYNLCQDGRFCIQVDLSKMLECELKCKLKPFRIYSIDTNPNYNGWVVVDWFSYNEFRIVDYGVESFEELNKAEDELKKKLGKASTGRYHYTEKKEYETNYSASKHIKRAAHYMCGAIVMDAVTIVSSDKKKGKYYNRLVNNQWLRTEFQNTYQRNAEELGARIIPVFTAYTSVNGNFVFRNLGLPDMCLAAFEMTRRAYLTIAHNLTEKDSRSDSYVFPDKDAFRQYFNDGCKELNIDDEDKEKYSIKELY